MAVMWMDTDDRDPRDLMPAPTERGLHDLGPSLTERRRTQAEAVLTGAFIASLEALTLLEAMEVLLRACERSGLHRCARALASITTDFAAEDQE